MEVLLPLHELLEDAVAGHEVGVGSELGHTARRQHSNGMRPLDGG